MNLWGSAKAVEAIYPLFFMFAPTNNEQFDPTQSNEIGNLDLPFGINDKNYDLNKASSFGVILESDPWAELEASSAEAKSKAFADELTGEEAASTQGFNSGGNMIQGGDTTIAEKDEVAGLLNDSRYNRDDISGTRDYTNQEWISRFDQGDSRLKAHDVGTIVYRDNAVINGNIGKTLRGVRDKNDYFKFNVGKTGEIQLSLTGLAGNTGLALYNSQGELLGISDKAGIASEGITKKLAKGEYCARVYNYDNAPWNHSQSSYTLNIERNADALESFWKNKIVDASIENAALNSIKYENHLSREDVIGVLNSARDLGSVHSSELTDLRNFYNYAIDTNHVRDDVKVLSEKVLFGNRSNQWYTGSDSVRDNLGNLAAGTSSTDMSLLIGKHFLGTDRPAIESDDSGSYTRAGGTLFKDGVSHDDIDQGGVGTCYVLASLAGTANDKPSVINNMFTDNGDGTWTVKFTTNGDTDYVTVDRMMATSASDRFIYANDGGDNGAQNLVNADNELWVALAEKAYAQLNESNEIGQDGTNSYGGISGGWSDRATSHITGIGASWGRASASGAGASVSGPELQAFVNSNRVVTVGGFDSSADGAFVGARNVPSTDVQSGVRRHAYSITGYNPANGQYSIRNPWDTQHLSLTHAQLVELNASIRWSNN